MRVSTASCLLLGLAGAVVQGLGVGFSLYSFRERRSVLGVSRNTKVTEVRRYYDETDDPDGPGYLFSKVHELDVESLIKPHAATAFQFRGAAQEGTRFLLFEERQDAEAEAWSRRWDERIGRYDETFEQYKERNVQPHRTPENRHARLPASQRDEDGTWATEKVDLEKAQRWKKWKWLVVTRPVAVEEEEALQRERGS